MHDVRLKELQRALRVACSCAELKVAPTESQAAALETAYAVLGQSSPKDVIGALVGLHGAGLNPFQLPIDLQPPTRGLVDGFGFSERKGRFA